MASNENSPAPTSVRLLGAAVLALIVAAVLTPSWDWGAGLESRITHNSLGAFFENEEGRRFNTNFRVEHGADLSVGFELYLVKPLHAAMFLIDVKGATRRLFPVEANDAADTVLFAAGRHELPIRLGLGDRRTEAFAVAIYDSEPFDEGAVLNAVERLERPITYERMRDSGAFPGGVYAVHLPALDAQGHAR